MATGPDEREMRSKAPIQRPRWRRMRGRLAIGAGLVVAAAVLAFVVVAGSESVSPPERGARVSGQAPSFELEGLRDQKRTVSLAGFLGRPVVVNFFAAWCAPCRREMPAFQSVYEDVEPDVALVGIDTRDIRSDGLALLRDTGVTYPAGFDPDGEVAREFGVVGMPTTVFVSADGEMLERVTGEMSAERLRATIERLFADAVD